MPALIEDLLRQESGSADIPRRSTENAPTLLRRHPGTALSTLILALFSPFLALRSAWVQRMLLAVVILDIPLQAGTHLFYRDADAASGALAGLSISATTVALIGLYTSWLIRTLQNRSQKTRSSTILNVPLLLYLGFAALSMVAARDIRLSCFELFLLAQMYLVFLYVATFVRTSDDVLFVLSFLLVGCLIESIFIVSLGFASLPSGLWGPLHIRVDQVNGELTRVGGTVGSPNEAGAYLSFVLSLAVSLLFANVERRYKWLATLVLVAGSAALVFTFSRGAWISFVLAIILFCLSLWRRNGVSFKAPLAILAILLISYIPFHQGIEARLLSDDNGSAESRIPLMKLAFRVIADNPILGVGSNNFSVVMDNYLTSEFRRGFLYTVHNKYLLVWSELGIAGLLAYLAFLFGVLRKGWACWRQNDRFLSVLALGLTVAITGYMVHQSVDIFQDRAVTQLLWLAAGLVVAIGNILHARCASIDPFSSIT